MTDRAILRNALAASARGDWAALSEGLCLSAVASPLDFLSDSSTEIASRLADVATSLHRVGAFDQGGARAALWVANISEWGDRPSARERARRRIAKALVELAPAGDRNILIVVTADSVDDVELVLPRQRTNGQLGTVRAIVSRTSPNRHHLELLEALVLAPGIGTAAITRRWNDAFSVERVTDAFYKEFRLLRDHFVAGLSESNPGHPLLDPGDDEAAQAELRRFVTRNLGRVLFLWFIQAKGWLDDDTSYLVNLYGRTATARREYFTEALLPLFFETLAVEPTLRCEAAKTLGDIPYLNGGLFVPTAVEDRLYGDDREHINITVPNELFDPRTHDSNAPTLLGLLSSYRFTTQESTPDDLSVDPDPELLGKVFENLNEDRKKTGTFYTPREIVRFMCREALDGYLVDKTGIERKTLAQLRLEAIDPAATDVHLTPEERKQLEKALLSVTVCDPAVGSGAFPVGMLQEVVQLLIGIEQSADVRVQIGGQKVAEWKEAVITNCLYGVDINPEAVEICQLRLWLSMVVDAERPVPLPNLDFRFEAGDSLVDRVGETRLRETLPRGGHQDAMLFDDLAEVEQELEALRTEYATVRDSVRARELRREIKGQQLELVRRQISDQLAGSERSLTDIKVRLDQLKRMGASARDLRREEKAAAALIERHEHLRAVLNGLSPDAPSKKPFLWPVEFPEVFEQGGFDIVIANPPYVRQEKLAAIDQETYALSFAEVHTGMADLLVYFFARGVQILRAGGHLAFITSNKFHRAAYGVRLRRALPTWMSLSTIVDFGDLPVFDAAAYPTITIGRRLDSEAEVGPAPPLVVAPLAVSLRSRIAADGHPESVQTVRDELAEIDRLVDAAAIPSFAPELLTSARWVLEPPGLVALLNRLVTEYPKLSEVIPDGVNYGVKTGLGDAFVVDSQVREQLIRTDARSAELLKPWLRGRDVKRWTPDWQGLHVVLCLHGTRIERYPAIEAHLAQWREELTPKTKAGQRGPGRKPGAYQWFEIQDNVAYHQLFERPKAIFNRFLSRPAFAWDDAGFYHNDACYMAPLPSPGLLAILNSKVAWFYLRQAGTDLQGGYVQVFVGLIEELPVPRLSSDDLRLLDGLVLQRLALADDGGSDDVEAIEEAIEAEVRRLFALTEAETRLLDEWYERDLGRLRSRRVAEAEDD